MAIRIKKEKVKEGIKYAIPITTLGVSTTNMTINAHRKKTDTEYQQRQLQAMNRLTRSLNKVDTSMTKLNAPPHYIEVQSVEPKKRGLAGRLFSLRSDGIKFRRGLNLEGILKNNGQDEAKEWLIDCSSTSKLSSNTDYSTEDFLRDSNIDVSINESLHKEIVNLLYSNGLLEILFVYPRSNDISRIDNILDSYCDKYGEEDTGYIATQLGHNIFYVEIKVKEGTETEIPQKLVESDFGINVLK